MSTRNYSYKNVDMVMASFIVANNLETNLPDLSLVRANWTPEYVAAFKERIQQVMDTYLGLDKKKSLRNATSIVLGIQETAKREVAFLKKQIEVDFPETKDQILLELGFTQNFRNVQKNDQEALIQLLFACTKGMTDELKTQITEKGTNPALIDKIIAYADQLKDADTTQENLKVSSKIVSEEAQAAFNDIYTECIGICKIASSYYQYDETKKAQFTFSKIVAAMNSGAKPNTTATTV